MNFAEFYQAAFSWPIEQEAACCLSALSFTNPALLHTVIDVGAGTGRFVPFFAMISDYYVAIEPDPEMVAVLKRTVERSAGDFTSSQIIPRSFENVTFANADAIFMLTDVVSYVSEAGQLSKFLSSAARSLRSNGILVIDCAIWKGPGERRCEEWESEGSLGAINAICEAATYVRDGHLRRTERLRFCSSAMPNDYAERQGELNAFTKDSLSAEVEKYGFKLVNIVDEQGQITQDISSGRGWFSFQLP